MIQRHTANRFGKLCSLFIFLCLTIPFAASSAESFTVRNGIKFNMTAEEIRDIEMSNGVAKLAPPEEMFRDVTNVYCSDVNIAGFDHGDIVYSLRDKNDDHENKLYKISYTWRKDCFLLGIDRYQPKDRTNVFDVSETDSMFDETKRMYDILHEALTGKYEVMGTYSSNSFIPSDLNDLNEFYIFLLTNEHADCYDITRYLAKDDDDYVDITSVCFKSESSETIQIEINICYQLITAEEYKTVVDQQKLNSDL